MLPTALPRTAPTSPSAPSTARPSTAVTTSPAFRPAAAAGEPATTCLMPAPEIVAAPCVTCASVTLTPRLACCTAPPSMSCETTVSTSPTGIAKPMPMLPAWPWPELREAIEELMPTRAPVASTSAPPLLPGLIAALVWIALVTTTSLSCAAAGSSVRPCCWPVTACVVTGRSRALTMPVVTVPDSPSGLPRAMTGSPTDSDPLCARVIGVRSDGGSSSRTTARSVVGSVPTTFAL